MNTEVKLFIALLIIGFFIIPFWIKVIIAILVGIFFAMYNENLK